MKAPGARGTPTAAAPGAQQARGSHGVGMVLVLAGVTCWSLGGVLVRLTDGIDIWQIVFYRSSIMLVVICIWIWSIHGSATLTIVRRAGTTAVIAGMASALAGLAFVAALFHTTVAQAVFMMGISPFCAALLGWWILRERVHRSTWIGMVVALIGLAIMLTGGQADGSFIGSILALYFAFAFACYSVLLRWGHNTEMIVAQIWNALLLIPFCAAVLLVPTPLRDTSGFEALMVGWHNVPVIIVMGAVQMSLGMILFTRGSRTVPAAQMSLLALAEPTLGPLWAWLVVAEVPTLATLIGGAVILSAVAAQVLLSPRSRGQFAHSLPIAHVEPSHAGQSNSPSQAAPQGADHPQSFRHPR